MQNTCRRITKKIGLRSASFDRALKRRHRFNASILPDSHYYNYLREESNRQIIDRINDINRSFPLALELGSYNSNFAEGIEAESSLRSLKGGVGGIENLIQCDIFSPTIKDLTSTGQSNTNVQTHFVQCDEEDLPFQSETFDIVTSSLYLHWSDDLYKTLQNIHRVLKPDGVFIASLFGNGTLLELRNSFYLAEQERMNGMMNHTSPFATSSDIAGLLQELQFNLPTVDIDPITVSYPNVFVLMEHLWKMGEGNASIQRQNSINRDSLLSMASIYQQLYGLEDRSIPATFEVIYLIGWKFHESQQKPCARGSAQRSLKDLSSK